MSGAETIFLMAAAVGAFAMPLLSRRIGVPATIAEVLYGIVLRFVLGPAPDEGLLASLAEIGFLVLMFGAGLELDLIGPLRRERLVLFLGLVYVFLDLVVAQRGAAWWGETNMFALLAAAISIGVAAAVLRESGQTRGRLGQLVLLAGGLGEFATILVLTVYDLRGRFGGGPLLLIGVGKLLGLLILGGIVLLVLRRLVWWFPQHAGRLAQSADPLETGVRAAVAFLFVGVAAANALGVERVLAAFLAGIVVGAVLPKKEHLEGKIATLGFGFFVPVFFIMVGLTVEPHSLLSLEAASFGARLAMLAFLAKVPAMAIFALAGVPWRQMFAAGLLLCAPLTLLVAIADIGHELHVLDDAGLAGVMSYAILSAIIYPVLAKTMLVGGNRRLAARPAT